jgi:hypothetical protein
VKAEEMGMTQARASPQGDGFERPAKLSPSSTGITADLEMQHKTGLEGANPINCCLKSIRKGVIIENRKNDNSNSTNNKSFNLP